MNISRKYIYFTIYAFLFFFFRYLFVTSYIFNNDEILSFRMVSDFKLYFVKDIHLFVYDYLITAIIGYFSDNSILCFRIINILFSLITVLFLYKIVKKEFGEKRSILFLLFVLFSPFFIFYNIYIENYNFSLMLLSIFLYFERFNKFGSLFRFIIILIAGYTHYFNIVFFFLYYLIEYFSKKRSFKNILIYFSSFIPLLLLVIYKYLNGYDNSILIDFNSNLLARFDANSFWSIFSWMIFGLKSNYFFLKIGVLILVFFFIIKIYYTSSPFLKKIYLLTVLYVFFIVCITVYANVKFNSSSFNGDYLLIIYPGILFFILSILNKKNMFFICVFFVCIYNISNIQFYKQVNNINKDFNNMNTFIKQNDVGFLVNNIITSEKNSPVFMNVIFNKKVQKISNVKVKNDYFIIPHYFEKDILYNLDKKILTGDEKYIFIIEEQAKEIKKNLYHYSFLENRRIGDDIYLIYKRKNQ